MHKKLFERNAGMYRSVILIIFLSVFIIAARLAPLSAETYEEAQKRQQEATKLITTYEQTKELLPGAKDFLLNRFGISVKGPVKIIIASGEQLDSMYTGAYKGAESGLYKIRDGVHCLYILTGLNKDAFMGCVAHEYTHAWQRENAPRNQDDVLREGFAKWIEYKYYQSVGAYTDANRVIALADPVYGVGFKLMIAVEDKNREKGVIEFVKKAVKYTDNY